MKRESTHKERVIETEVYKTDKIVYVTVAATTIVDIPVVVVAFDAETTMQNPLYLF